MVTKGKPCNNTIKLNIVQAIPAYGYMTAFTPPVLATVLMCPSSLSSRSRAKAVPKKLDNDPFCGEHTLWICSSDLQIIGSIQTEPFRVNPILMVAKSG